MSCDCEWGLPMRLHSGGTEFPHLMALEKMGDLKGITQVAKAIGDEMSSLGLHWNFAPVADINSNPNNPIINIRAFSGDPDTVAECAKHFYEGLENAGIIATAKHFPGHGDTNIDSHYDLPVIDKSFEEFDALELIPFKDLVMKGIPSIMTGHISAPKLARSLGAQGTSDHLPATISPFLTHKLLREEIGFEGVIITDSLEMYGLRKILSDPGEIALHAFTAGADILLMPTDPIAAFDALANAFAQGILSEGMINNRVERIDKLRSKYAVPKPLSASVQWQEHDAIASGAARRSITVEGQIPKPLRPSSVLIASGSVKAKKQVEMITTFFTSHLNGIGIYMFDNMLSASDIDMGRSPLLIFLQRPHGVLTGEAGTESLSSRALVVMKEINTHPLGVICFGDPYIADQFTNEKTDFLLRTYSDSIPSVRSTLQLLSDYL
jgi:beta-glucosidase-like glycosyl hydrolase